MLQRTGVVAASGDKGIRGPGEIRTPFTPAINNAPPMLLQQVLQLPGEEVVDAGIAPREMAHPGGAVDRGEGAWDADQETAARLQHPPQLTQGRRDVGEELKEDPGVNGFVDSQGITHGGDIPDAPFDLTLNPSGHGAGTSAANHLRSEVNSCDPRTALSEGDGILAAATAGIEQVRAWTEVERFPDAFEIGCAIRGLGVGFGAGVPALGAGIPGGAGVCQPRLPIVAHLFIGGRWFFRHREPLRMSVWAQACDDMQRTCRRDAPARGLAEIWSTPETDVRTNRTANAIGLVLMLALAACSPLENTTPTPTPPATATAEPVTANLEELGAVIVASPPPGDAAAGGIYVVTFDAADVVARVMPAVVTVINEQRFSDGFFGESEVEAGRGTGFAIDGSGNIVTNEHVVRGGSGFKVLLSNGEKRDATLVGADPLSDLAVVRMDGPPLATVAFGDSNSLRQGQPVLAIGSPLGDFTGTVTSGIVSALNRDFPYEAQQPGEEVVYTDLIQHDAAINPGNSGGPLFDIAGRVIGVNTLGIPQSGRTPVQGLFFAIPANHVSRIVGELIENGEVSYPFIGVNYAPISPEIAAQNNLSVDYGAYLQNVDPGGPAGRAGLQEGDIITAIAGQRISGQTTFTEALFAHQPGDTVEVTILRGGRERSAEVTLADRPPRPR